MVQSHRQAARQEHVEPAPLIGRDELNLAEFPIALIADRVPAGQKTLYFQGKHGRLTVTGSDAFGLPTAADADVIVALLYLTKFRNNFRDVKVNFSKYELIKLLNWRDEGDSYRRLDLSFNRWTGVLLVYDKSWWNNKTKRYTSAKMHILDSVVFAEPGGRGRAAQPYQPLSTFSWNKTFIESCQADNLRQLDLDVYFSLNSAIAKRLYRFLGKRFYRQDEWTFDLNEIAFDRVGLTRTSEGNAGKIKEKLRPAIDELEAIGFLRPLTRDERYKRIDRGHWTIQLARQSPTRIAPAPSAPAVAEPEAPLAAELVSRGITKASAAELVQQYPADRIAQKIEVFDWLTEKKDKRIAKSPAGYLVKSIADDYSAPKGFLSRADRDQREQARKASEREAVEKRRQEREQQERDQAEQKAVAAYWDSLSPEQQSQLQTEADAQADAETLALEKGPMKRLARQIRRDEYIRQLLESRELVPADS